MTFVSGPFGEFYNSFLPAVHRAQVTLVHDSESPRKRKKKKDALRVGLQRAGSKAKRMEEEKKKKKGDKKEAVLVGFLFFLFVLPFRSTATVAC